VTVIAAYADPDVRRVLMACDTGATDGFGRVWADQPKILRKTLGTTGQHALLGIAGKRALYGLARHNLSIDGAPNPDSLEDLDEWAHRIAQAWTELAVEAKPPATNDNGHLDGDAILGHAGRLWHLTEGLADRITSGYTAIGSGGDLALGALHVLSNDLEDAEQVLYLACAAACAYDDGCHMPLQLERLEQHEGDT